MVRIGYEILLVLSLLIGLSAALIGLVDALLAARPDERVMGALIALTGLSLLIAAGRTEHRRGQVEQGGLTILGFAAGTIPGTALAAVQVTTYGANWRLIVWIVAALVPFGVVAVLWAHGLRPRLKQPTAWLAVVTSLVAVALPAIGGAFRAVSDPEILDLELTSSVVGVRVDPKLGQVALVDTVIRVENISDRRLILVASTYSVQGLKTELRDSSERLSEADLAGELRDQGWSGAFESPWDEIDLIECGQLYSTGDYLEPGQHDITNLVTPIPLSRYNTASVLVTAATGFADRLQLGRQVEHGGPGDGFPIRYVWRTNPIGAVNYLTSGDQQLAVEFRYENADFGPFLDFEISSTDYRARPPSLTEDYNPRAESIGWTNASRQVSLDLSAD